MANSKKTTIEPGKATTKRNKLADSVRKSVKKYLADLKGEEATGVYQMVLSEVEKPLLEVIMNYSDDNQSKAARALGINRNTLRKKLQCYDMGD